MNVSFSADELRPVVAAVVAEVLATRSVIDGKLGSRLAFTEVEAAALLGVARHTLRDARLRGEIAGRLLGKKIIYSRDELVRFLGETSK